MIVGTPPSNILISIAGSFSFSDPSVRDEANGERLDFPVSDALHVPFTIASPGILGPGGRSGRDAVPRNQERRASRTRERGCAWRGGACDAVRAGLSED